MHPLLGTVQLGFAVNVCPHVAVPLIVTVAVIAAHVNVKFPALLIL